MLGCIQPMSSPMMKRMLGLACCCCAAAGVLATITAVDNASRPSQIFLAIRMVHFLIVGCPRRAGSLRPITIAPMESVAHSRHPFSHRPRSGDTVLRGRHGLELRLTPRPQGQILATLVVAPGLQGQ